jgi:hypothetical protein
MKQMLLFSGIIVGMLAGVGSAVGNPMSCETFRARQVPGSTHVQITFADQCTQDGEITSLSRDKEEMDPEWQPFDGFVANMGSGLMTVPANQVCDCDVALGRYQYQLTYESHYGENEYNRTVEVVDPDTMVVDDEDDEEVETDSEVMPWDIPEPEEIQGLDCIAACEEGGPGVVTPPIEDIFPNCAVTAPGTESERAAWPVLFLLAALPVWLVRRSRKRGR